MVAKLKRKTKSLKGINFKVEDIVQIGDVEIPITSRSVNETTKILGSVRKNEIPKKTRYATPEEAEILKKRDGASKGIPMVTVYDETSDKYQIKMTEIGVYFRILESVGQYIDMDCETDTGNIWTDWEISMGDWEGVAKYLSSNFTQKELDTLENAMKGKFGSQAHSLLVKLEEMSGKSAIEILRTIKRFDDIDKLEFELSEKMIVLKDMEEKMYEILDTINSASEEFDEEYNMYDDNSEVEDVEVEYSLLEANEEDLIEVEEDVVSNKVEVEVQQDDEKGE